jgi:hypothetical protein
MALDEHPEGYANILTIHLDLRRNICLQDYQSWAELFLCTFFGGRIFSDRGELLEYAVFPAGQVASDSPESLGIDAIP